MKLYFQETYFMNKLSDFQPELSQCAFVTDLDFVQKKMSQFD